MPRGRHEVSRIDYAHSDKLSAMRLGMMWVFVYAYVSAFGTDVYFNDFNAAPGTMYPEWTSSGYRNSANHAGTVAAETHSI